MSGDRIEFDVFGIPRPQGSITAWVDNEGRQRAKYNGTLHEWRGAITVSCRAAYCGPKLIGPVAVLMDFELPRSKSHFGTGRNAGLIKASAPKYPATAPDCDKLVRAVLDSVTMGGNVWQDDGQVCRMIVDKRYADVDSAPGVHIEIWCLDEPGLRLS